jgi:hypothetical protein
LAEVRVGVRRRVLLDVLMAPRHTAHAGRRHLLRQRSQSGEAGSIERRGLMERKRPWKSRRVKPNPAVGDEVEAIESMDPTRPGRRVKNVVTDNLRSRADLWRRLWR